MSSLIALWQEWPGLFMSSLIAFVTRMARLVYAVTDRLRDKNDQTRLFVADRLCDKTDQARLCRHWSPVWQEWPGLFMSSLIACVTRMARLVYVVTDRLCDKNGPACLCRHWSPVWQEWPGSLMPSLIVCVTRMARLVYVVTDRLCKKNAQARLWRRWSPLASLLYRLCDENHSNKKLFTYQSSALSNYSELCHIKVDYYYWHRNTSAWCVWLHFIKYPCYFMLSCNVKT